MVFGRGSEKKHVPGVMKVSIWNFIQIVFQIQNQDALQLLIYTGCIYIYIYIYIYIENADATPPHLNVFPAFGKLR